MCGICGQLKFQGMDDAGIEQVERMSAALQHRGPDEHGCYHDQNIAMGFRRLSIIDLHGASQPIYNEDNTVVLVCNGEIYNYQDLRKQLAGRHTFSTNGDCETIVHLYEENGIRCVQYLRGMFSFALWDSRKRMLLLARDRMGEKPLYFYENDNGILFASELKSLLASNMVKRDLDMTAINMYFHYQFVPEPRTPISGVSKLGAAQTMCIYADDLRCETDTYWSMEDVPPNDEDPVEAIRASMDAACRDVVQSDVPIGISLSGGLDSSVVAALVSNHSTQRVHAFTAGYEGRPECDERNDAKVLAEHLGMPFHEVEISSSDMMQGFQELIKSHDEPIADIAGFGYLSIMRAAQKEGIRVMVQGQGADELLGGYPHMQEAYERSMNKRSLRKWGALVLPRYLKIARPRGREPWQLRRWAEEWFGLKDGWQNFRIDCADESCLLPLYSAGRAYKEMQSSGPSCFTEEFSQAAGHPGKGLFEFDWINGDIRDKISALMCKTYLLSNGIAQGDRLSMSCSVEMRLPFVDYRLVETIMGLRKNMPRGCFTTKHWLKEAFRELMPGVVLDRPKRGFSPPSNEWFRQIFAEYGRYLVDGELVRMGVLTRPGAQTLSEGFLCPAVSAPLSFKALVLELWVRNVLYGKDSGAVVT